jgi:hypothetical protein
MAKLTHPNLSELDIFAMTLSDRFHRQNQNPPIPRKKRLMLTSLG